MMRRLVFAFLVGAAILGLSMQVHAQAFEGVYTVEGTNIGGGKTYHGVLEVTAKDSGYMCVWTLGKTEQGEWITAKGYGFISNGHFSVAIVSEDPDGRQFLTVAAYELAGDKWKGKWSLAPSGLVGVETLTPSKKDAAALKRALPTPGGRTL